MPSPISTESSGLAITERNGEFFVTSEAVASGAGVQHASVLRVIDDNMDDFESFGQVGFEIRPGYNNAKVRVALLNEQQSTLLMTYQRNTEQVRQFKKALVKAFYEMARQVQAPKEVSRRDLAQMVLAAEDEADRQRERAEIAEHFRDVVERSKGLNPTEFIKHYFPAHKRSEVFAYLYSSGLLINQLSKGTKRSDGTFRDGPQHGHPSHTGRRFFYLASAENKKTGFRGLQTRVTPGDPELALVAHLEKRGFSPLTQFSNALESAHV